MSDEISGVERANRMARDARARVMGLARAAREMGAVPAPRAGEPLPEALTGGPGENPDPLDLPAGLYPVGGRPPGMPDLILPGEELPVGMQSRAAARAITEAAREAGLRAGSVSPSVRTVPPSPPAVFNPPFEGDTVPGFVNCYLTGHTRVEIREAMIEAITAAARTDGYRPTSQFGFWMDEDRRARWGEIVAMGPQTEGLRAKLAAAADVADAPGGHIGQWFQRTAGHLAEAAYDAGVPLAIFGTATRPSGFQATWSAAHPTQLAADPDYKPAGRARFAVDLHAYEPAEFVSNVIDVILYGNFIGENTDQHARLSQELWAAAVARFHER